MTFKRDPRRVRAEQTLHQRWEKIGFDRLLPVEQQYVALYWLITEVNDGGFHQYFFNSSGDMALLAKEGLKEVGAAKSLKILEEALAVFPPGGYSTDRASRWNGLKAISHDADAEIQEFDHVTAAFQEFPEGFQGLALDRLAALYSSNGIWPTESGNA